MSRGVKSAFFTVDYDSIRSGINFRFNKTALDGMRAASFDAAHRIGHG
jgi:hypothetical protein